MKPVTSQTIQDLIALTPNTAENQTVLQQLDLLASQLNVVEEPYTYTNTLSVANASGTNSLASAAVSAQIVTPVDASAMFIIENQTYMATTAQAAMTEATHIYPLVMVMIIDTGTSKQWMDQPVGIPMIFGDGRFPYFLPKPRIVPANAQIGVTYTNFDAAAGYNIRLAFNGYRLYSLAS